MSRLQPSEKFRQWVHEFGVTRLASNLGVNRGTVHAWTHPMRPHLLRPAQALQILALSIEHAGSTGPLNWDDLYGAAIAAEAMPLLKEEAKKRMLAGRRMDPMEKSTQGYPKGAIREIAAETVGVSGFSVQHAANIREADPETFERIKAGEMTPLRHRALLEAKFFFRLCERGIMDADQALEYLDIPADLERKLQAFAATERGFDRRQILLVLELRHAAVREFEKLVAAAEKKAA